MFKILKMHLENNGYDNHIYFSLTNEEMALVRNLLNKDNGYLDIIISFEELNLLDKLINNIPNYLDKNYVLKNIYEQYICYKIVSQVELEDKYNFIGSLDEKELSLFDGNFDLFKNSLLTPFMIIERELDELAKDNNTKARIHFLFDGVNNNILQQVINDYFSSRSPICFMGYTTKSSLLHFYNTNGGVMQAPHDYCSFYPYDFSHKLNRK